MTPEIKCKVSNCKYNERDCCHANCITVTNCHCHKANSEKDTECQTFEIK